MLEQTTGLPRMVLPSDLRWHRGIRRTVPAASAPAVVAQRGTGRMGHLVRPWLDPTLHGAGAHTGGRTRVTRTRGVHDAATLRALEPVIEQPGECVTGKSVDMSAGRVLRCAAWWST